MEKQGNKGQKLPKYSKKIEKYRTKIQKILPLSEKRKYTKYNRILLKNDFNINIYKCRLCIGGYF